MAVNSLQKAGKITELLAEEDSTVTVGQDLFKLEPGEGGDDTGDNAPKAAPEGGARSEPKEPEEGNKQDAAPEAKKEKGAREDVKERQEEETKPSSTTTQEEKPAAPAPPPPSPPKKEEKPSKSKEEPKQKAVGSRNETRVSFSSLRSAAWPRVQP